MENKIILLSSIFLLSASFLTGCNQEEIRHKVTNVMDHVFEVAPYKTLDEKFADNWYYKNNYNWGGGCSAVAKVVNDHMCVGRNMDLNISNKAAYVVRTEVGKYKTVGLAYTFRDYAPDNDEVLAKGLNDEFYKILPFMCDDVLNDQGLYIELNMRNAEAWPTGEDKFACSGTNPAAKKTVHMFELPRYIAENCATLDQAFGYVRTLNIYSKKNYWNYSFMVADKNGDYGVIEIASNFIFCYKYQNIQTNFYLTPEFKSISQVQVGLGRYETLKNGYESVVTKADLYELIKSVSYYQYYDPMNCKFDPRSELIGSQPWWTYDVVMDPDNKDAILFFLNQYGNFVRSLTRQQQRNDNEYWESTFTELVDCTDLTILVRFYENESMYMTLDFNY